MQITHVSAAWLNPFYLLYLHRTQSFCLLRTSLQSGASVSWCTWHLKKEGPTDLHRNWRNHSREEKKKKKGFWLCLPYKGCLTVSTWHQKPLTQLLLGGTVAAVTAEISPGQIFMWATCSQWNHFEQQDSFLQSEEIGTLTPATIYFISVLRVMKGTIFLTICLTERHILCVDQFQRANGKVHITSPAVKAFVNIIIIKEA